MIMDRYIYRAFQGTCYQIWNLDSDIQSNDTSITTWMVNNVWFARQCRSNMLTLNKHVQYLLLSNQYCPLNFTTNSYPLSFFKLFYFFFTTNCSSFTIRTFSGQVDDCQSKQSWNIKYLIRNRTNRWWTLPNLISDFNVLSYSNRSHRRAHSHTRLFCKYGGKHFRNILKSYKYFQQHCILQLVCTNNGGIFFTYHF